MKKRLFAISLCIMILTGCWDRKELNTLGIVGAIGFDKNNITGKIIVTCQIIRPEATKSDDKSSQISPVKIITTNGNTVFEAVVNVSKLFDKAVYFNHCKIIAIGQELAEDGVSPIMDFLGRYEGIRMSNWVIVAKNTTAKELLTVNNGFENIQAFYLAQMIKLKKINSESSSPTILDFYKRISSSEISPIAGAMEFISDDLHTEEKNISTKGVKFSGTAVFKKDKLVGYLDNIETRGLNWVTGKMQRAQINIPLATEDGKLNSVRIIRSSSSIKPEIKNGEISININIKTEGELREQQGTIDVSNPKVLEEVEKREEEVIEKEIKRAIEKVKNELGSDILGFGNVLHRKYPKEWEKVKNNWDTKFSEVDYKVNVDAKIRRTGNLIKAINVD